MAGCLSVPAGSAATGSWRSLHRLAHRPLACGRTPAARLWHRVARLERAGDREPAPVAAERGHHAQQAGGQALRRALGRGRLGQLIRLERAQRDLQQRCWAEGRGSLLGWEKGRGQAVLPPTTRLLNARGARPGSCACARRRRRRGASVFAEQPAPRAVPLPRGHSPSSRSRSRGRSRAASAPGCTRTRCPGCQSRLAGRPRWSTRGHWWRPKSQSCRRPRRATAAACPFWSSSWAGRRGSCGVRGTRGGAGSVGGGGRCHRTAGALLRAARRTGAPRGAPPLPACKCVWTAYCHNTVHKCECGYSAAEQPALGSPVGEAAVPTCCTRRPTPPRPAMLF